MKVDYLIKINNIITCSNYVTLRKINVNPYEYDRIYMDKDLVEDSAYQTIDQFTERKITPLKFYSILLNKINPLSDGNGRRCRIQLANNDKTNKIIDGTKIKKPII